MIDLGYAYSQMKLAPEASKHCNIAITGEKSTDITAFQRYFTDQLAYQTEKTDWTLVHQTQVWLDDTKVETRGTKEQPKN